MFLMSCIDHILPELAVYHSNADELNSDDNDDDDDHVQQMSDRHSVTERVESISVG